MFKKILIANRGGRAEGAGAHAPHCVARAACAGDLTTMEVAHV
jgi:hypothetical protein